MGVNNINLVPIAPAPTTPEVSVQGLERIGQWQPNWCWAACALMVLRLYNKQVSNLCDVVNKLRPGANCCVEFASRLCSPGCEPDDIHTVYQAFGIRSTIMPLSSIRSLPAVTPILVNIQLEIDAQRPVEVCYSIGSAGSHVVLISGYIKEDPGILRFRILDPGLIRGSVLASNLSTLDNDGQWKFYWTGIA